MLKTILDKKAAELRLLFLLITLWYKKALKRFRLSATSVKIISLRTVVRDELF